jgi:hypothetical protein
LSIMTEEPRTTLPQAYTWEVEGKPVSIRISFELIDKLSQEIMKGFGAVPRRGAEVAGILLGKSDRSGGQLRVEISGYALVPCSYRKGPSWVMDAEERSTLEAILLEKRITANPDERAVGFFRSHTRDGGLSLSDEDLALFGQYFPDPSNIILLVRPYATRSSVAGFFFEEGDGQLRRDASWKEFPFRRNELGGGSTREANRARRGSDAPNMALEGGHLGQPALGSAAPAANETTSTFRSIDAAPFSSIAAAAAADEAEAESDTTERLKSLKGRWLWLPLSFLFLLLGVLLGFQAAIILNKDTAKRSAADATSLGLKVEREGDMLRITWKGKGGAIAAAKGGVLHITDNGNFKDVTLDPARLETGAIHYRSTVPGVRFVLDVTLFSGTVISESAAYDSNIE